MFGSSGYNANRYRETQVNSATPGQLVVMLYDHALKHLAIAEQMSAPDQGLQRSDALQVCRAVITELLVTLDRQRGGTIAPALATLYSFLLGEMTTLGLHPDATRIRRIAGIIRELRNAFAEAAIGIPRGSVESHTTAR